MTDLEQARETLAEYDRQIAKLEYETRQRVERMTGLDGDADFVSRQEWSRFNLQVAPIRSARDHLAKAIATIVGMAAPAPVIIVDQQSQPQEKP